MKSTAQAPSNIAFIKYWGRKDETLRLPENGSISMNLSNLQTVTTVEFNPSFKEDTVTIDGVSDARESDRVSRHLDRIRSLAHINDKATVVSHNNFPTGTGLSSSASGFAALTVAASRAAGLSLNERELSILARQGSGSACRSIPSGFVEWLDGATSDDSYAVSLYTPDYWNIVDVVLIMNEGKKEISTSEGMQAAHTSPFFEIRHAGMAEKIQRVKLALSRRDFTLLGSIAEAEALEMHAVMMTSSPSLFYLLPGTVRIMRVVRRLRNEGLPVYFTLNTGQDVHVLMEQKNAWLFQAALKQYEDIHTTSVNTAALGAHEIESHLF